MLYDLTQPCCATASLDHVNCSLASSCLSRICYHPLIGSCCRACWSWGVAWRGVAWHGTVQCGVSRYVLSLNYSVGHILSRLPCCWVLFASAAQLVVASDGHNWLIASAQRYPGAYKHKHCLCSHTRSERHMSTRTVERPWALTRTFGCIAARTLARRIWL